jgi:hypothetical protein
LVLIFGCGSNKSNITALVVQSLEHILSLKLHDVELGLSLVFHFRLGEWCTHIAGLLFALENITETQEKNEVDTAACTSKPCGWNKPSKRSKTCKTVDEIKFKRIKYDNDKEKEILKCKRKTEIKLKPSSASCNFRDKICSKLGTTRAVIFDLLEPQPNINTNEHICSDLNVGRTESIETSEHITFSSDKYINLTTTIEIESLSPESFLDFVTNIPSSVAEELEFRWICVKYLCDRLS